MAKQIGMHLAHRKYKRTFKGKPLKTAIADTLKEFGGPLQSKMIAAAVNIDPIEVHAYIQCAIREGTVRQVSRGVYEAVK